MDDIKTKLIPVAESKAYLQKLKEVVAHFKQNEVLLHDKSLVSLLVQVYFECSPKFPGKRVLASFFQNLPAELAGKVEQCLQSQLTAILDLGMRSVSDPTSSRALVEQINCLMENFKLALNFLAAAFECFVASTQKALSPVEMNQAMHHCLVTIKTLSRLLQKCYGDALQGDDETDTVHAVMKTVSHSGAFILKQDDFLTDCRSCVGMALVQLLKISHVNDCLNILLTSIFKMPQKEGLLKSSSTVNLCELTDAKLSVTSTLCLYFGLLSMLDPKDMVQPLATGGWVLTTVFLDRLLTLAEKCDDTGSKILLAKAMTLWTSRTCSFIKNDVCSKELSTTLSGNGDAVKSILGYIWTTWDDQLDVLRQNARIAFENCIKIHLLVTRTDPHKDSFICQSTQNLLQVSWTNKGKYGCLASVVSHIGTEFLLQLNPGIAQEILSQLEEQSLACYASDLFDTLFKADFRSLCVKSGESSHEGVSSWLTRWVDPVVKAMCQVNKNIKLHVIEYVLPKLLKFNQETLSYMINKLSGTGAQTRAEIGALVMCIRRARALGLLNRPHSGTLKSSHGQGNKNSPPGGLWYGLVSADILKYALTCGDEQVRLDAFALLCENMKTTEPVSELEFSLLRYFLQFNLNNQSPAFRQCLLSYLQKLLSRMRESAAAQKRLHSKGSVKTDSTTAAAVLRSYDIFLQWFQSYLFNNLYPGSAFARRLTVLSALVQIVDVFPEQDGKDVYHFTSHINYTHINTLIECLTDTFEENKIAATKILHFIFKHGHSLGGVSELRCLFSAAFELSRSTRPHDCTTACYIFRVLLHQPIIEEVMRSHDLDLKSLHTGQEVERIYRETCIFSSVNLHLLSLLLISLQDQIAVAKKNLLVAAANRPMYPTMHCIRYILSNVKVKLVPKSDLEQWKKFIHGLIDVCLELARVVSPVVQDSSPEGNVPTEAIMGPGMNMDALILSADDKAVLQKAVDSEQTVKLMPEYLVVCCWRSIKEVSLVLGQITQDVPVGDAGILNFQQISSIGGYFTTQLLESKHRGAFELAYAGFVKMCEMLWKSVDGTLHQLPGSWLNEVMCDIVDDDPNSRLCATRRSAGVPFYVQALVTTEPASTGRTCFKSVMFRLLELALNQDSTNQAKNSQVHSLNILRALFRDTRLGDDVTSYVADGLKAAILGFKSQVWAVRNSSTLLLSALMTRMFGVKRSKDENTMSKKNCQTGRAFFHRYPSLHPFLLAELKEATENIDCQETLHLHPSLYPVLMVLGRLFPSSLEGADTHLNMAAFIPYILMCGSSPVYKTRLMAARALQPLAMKDQLTSLLLQLVTRLPKCQTNRMRQSYIHGILLQIQHLLALITPSNSVLLSDILSTLIPHWMNVCWLATRINACIVSRKVALEITDMFISLGKSLENTDFVKTLKDHLLTVLQDELNSDIQYPMHIPTLTEFSTTVSQLCLKYGSCKETRHSENKHWTFENIVLQLLGSEMYEVRLATLKTLYSRLSWLTGKYSVLADVEKERETEWMTTERVKDSEEVYSKLLEMATNTECHHECLALVYAVLYVHPCVMTDKNSTEIQTFQLIVDKLKLESRSEVNAAMFQFSGELLPQIYSSICEKSESPEEVSVLSDWCDVMEECSRTEQSVDIQLCCASVLQNNAKVLLLDPRRVLGNRVLKLWKVTFDLLQEDDLDVKDTAALVLMSLTDNSLQSELQSTVVLERLLTSVTSQHDIKACMTSLLTWITREEAQDQNEETRLFDKGEMNTYREDIKFVEMCKRQVCEVIGETTPSDLTEKVEKQLQDALKSQLQTLSSDTSCVDRNMLFLETGMYHKNYETLYRTCSALKVAEQLHKSDSLRNVCDQVQAVIDEKIPSEYRNYRLDLLVSNL